MPRLKKVDVNIGRRTVRWCTTMNLKPVRISARNVPATCGGPGATAVSHPDRDQAERRDEEGRGIEEQHVLDADMRNRDPTDRRPQQHPGVGRALDRRHRPRSQSDAITRAGLACSCGNVSGHVPVRMVRVSKVGSERNR